MLWGDDRIPPGAALIKLTGAALIKRRTRRSGARELGGCLPVSGGLLTLQFVWRFFRSVINVFDGREGGQAGEESLFEPPVAAHRNPVV